MNFVMYKVAESVMWPVYILLDAWTGMYKVKPYLEMKRGFYGTYDLSSE